MKAIGHIFGIEIVEDQQSEEIAEAKSFPWRKRIIVGPRWFFLPPREQHVVLCHEAEHCRRNHFLMRLLVLPLCWTRFGTAIAHRHEYEADAFVVEQGYGVDLLRFLGRYRHLRPQDDPFHPTPKQRAENILRLMKEGGNELAA